MFGNLDYCDASILSIKVFGGKTETMGDWQAYADQVLGRFDYEQNTFVINNVCSGAAIYGHDGTLWASAGSEGNNLSSYGHPVEQADGST